MKSTIQPGKPTQNVYIERFNRTFREEVLSLYAFQDLNEVRDESAKWQYAYNSGRPHTALNGQTPWGYLASHEANRKTSGGPPPQASPVLASEPRGGKPPTTSQKQ